MVFENIFQYNPKYPTVLPLPGQQKDQSIDLNKYKYPPSMDISYQL